MAGSTASGASTPVSPSSTLSAPASPKLKAPSNGTHPISNFHSASSVIEYLASRSSSSVFLYDLAHHAGFGPLTASWAGAPHAAPVIPLQTRAGAGLSLLGRLSEGSSKDAARDAVLTAYTTPSGLASMLPALAHLPPATPSSRLVLQVPTVTPVGERFALSPTIAPFAALLPFLPANVAVLLSATPQEAIEFAALSYNLADSHVIHLFDHHGAARETGHTLNTPTLGADRTTLVEGLKSAGYSSLEYCGDQDAKDVLVILNGPLALAARSFVSRASGVGLIIVRVLRPWNEDAIRNVLPASTKRIHVIDEVPSASTQGALYLDVFTSLLEPITGPLVSSHRIVPTRTEEFASDTATFYAYIRSIVPTAIPVSVPEPSNIRKVVFLGTPESPLSALSRIVQQTLSSHNSVSVRLLTDHDALSKPGGVIADRMVLAPPAAGAASKFVPLASLLSIRPDSHQSADFVAILDQSLLKSHDVVRYAAHGSPVLVVTTWTAEELGAALPPEVTAIVQERSLHLCTLDAKQIASEFGGETASAQKVLENIAVLLAFLRLYLGKAATQDAVYRLARANFGASINGIELAQLSRRVWGALVGVELAAPETATEIEHALKTFEFNAIAAESADDEASAGARLGSWHDAAKHIIFPSAFAPPVSADDAERNPALRPELPERTFLITCTVNRRLTPLEYNRNVFHVEFDTRGTGLRYEIGEALGVHGWNDAEEVLDFCSWYGADPDRLITLPVPGTDGARWHTRTVFQALQQQVDLFGKPTKTFYSALAEYATSQADRYALQFIGAPEGVATFKKLSEKDTVHFADILRRYTSARPGIEVLCELVGDIKPRHYSIASAQSVVGDRVDLLVVTVDWVTPSGSPRYGQCTKYLAGLKVGQKVTVSIKPSVMKVRDISCAHDLFDLLPSFV